MKLKGKLFAKTRKIEPKLEFDRINQSSVGTFNLCKRRFYWEYIRQLQSTGIYIPFLVGSAVHKGIQALYKGSKVVESFQAAHEYIAQELDEKFLDPKADFDLSKTKAMVSGMLQCYADENSYELSNRKVKFTEESLLVNIPHLDVEFIGTIDLAFNEKKDTLELADYKTPGQFDANKFKCLPMDLQLGLYAKAATLVFGKKITNYYYECIKKPGIRLRQTESPSEYIKRIREGYKESPENYFHKEIINYSVRSLCQIWCDFILTLEDIKGYYTRLGPDGILKAENWPRNTNACQHYNRLCPYADICLHGETADKLIWFQQRKDIDRGKIHKSQGDMEDEVTPSIDLKIKTKSKKKKLKFRLKKRRTKI